MFVCRVILGFPHDEVSVQFVVLVREMSAVQMIQMIMLTFFTATQSVKSATSERGTCVPSTTALILLLA
jgi:hypothetical protein